jgi:hypothetical protein
MSQGSSTTGNGASGPSFTDQVEKNDVTRKIVSLIWNFLHFFMPAAKSYNFMTHARARIFSLVRVLN